MTRRSHNIGNKFNPYHDERGRFTFGPNGVQSINYQPTNNDKWPTQGNSNLNVGAAVEALRNNAEDAPTGYCARYVRQAIAAGGVTVTPPSSGDAKDYGPQLQAAGFVQLSPTPPPNYLPQIGDVVVIQPYSGGNSAGHMAMFDGQNWISDFVQNPQYIPSHDDIWPGGGYRQYKPSYAIYRP